MQTKEFNQNIRPEHQRWVSLGRSFFFLFTRKRLLGLSFLLFLATALFTWLGSHYAIQLVDTFTQSFFSQSPETSSIVGWIKNLGLTILRFLYLFITRIVAFYLAFLVAYTLTSPGYGLLSAVAEKLWAGDQYEEDEGLTFSSFLTDFLEAVKIACFGIVVTIVALLVNFIPLLGQVFAFLLYTYYSALMFLDYPASRRRWNLGKKLKWMGKQSGACFLLGIFPAFISMLPIINVFLISLVFPLLTVHATLNFTNIEIRKNLQTPSAPSRDYGN